MTSVGNVALLSTADWDATLWTNKQHTARALRDQGSRVLYVESMGLRPPSLRGADARRIVRRLVRMFAPPKEVEPNIFRWSPPSIPMQRHGLVRTLNRILTSLTLRFWAHRLLGDRHIVWTYNPLTTALVSMPSRRPLIYHCVDDVAAQPTMPSEAIARFERELVARATKVFVTSRELEARWSPVGSVSYFPNCVDAEHFARRDPVDPDALAELPRPRLGFVGAVADYKIDVDLLDRAARLRPDWSLVVIGPREDRNPRLTALLELPNVHYLGPKSYEDLPRYMQALDVGLIPAQLNEYTRSMFPMKFFEYLAAGIPVVSTPLPALDEYSDVATFSPPAEFVQAVDDVLRGKSAGLDVRLAAAQQNTYVSRTRRMLAEIQVENGLTHQCAARD